MTPQVRKSSSKNKYDNVLYNDKIQHNLLDDILPFDDEMCSVVSEKISRPNSKPNNKPKAKTFYETIYEKDNLKDPNSKFPILKIQNHILNCTKTGHYDPIIYQAITSGCVTINAGGVYDISDEYIHPVKIYEPIRILIYKLLFPMTDQRDKIKIVEYYDIGERNSITVQFTPHDSFEYSKNRLLSLKSSEVPDEIDFLAFLNNELKLGYSYQDLYMFTEFPHLNWGLPLIIRYIYRHCNFNLKLNDHILHSLYTAFQDREMNHKSREATASDNARKYDKEMNRFYADEIRKIEIGKISQISTIIHSGFYNFGLINEIYGKFIDKTDKTGSVMKDESNDQNDQNKNIYHEKIFKTPIPYKAFHPTFSFNGEKFRLCCMSPAVVTDRKMYEWIKKLVEY